MWLVKLALSRPYTFIVFSLVLLLISPVVLLRTPVDTLPSINIPVISVIWTFTGLAPAEMETRIVSIFERSLTTSVNNIEHIESQSLNGVAVVKVFLQPTADINGAISEVIAEAQVGLNARRGAIVDFRERKGELSMWSHKVMWPRAAVARI